MTPRPLRGGGAIDCGLAGTVMRFLPPLAALADGPVAFDGDPAARQRPMGPLLAALRALGVTIDDDGRGTLPFTVHGTGAVRGGHAAIDASVLQPVRLGPAAGRVPLRRRARARGPGPVPSQPHIEMTLAMLNDAGVPAEQTATGRWTVAAAAAPRRPPGDGAGPVQRRALPGGRPGLRGPGHRAAIGRSRPPSPATTCAGSCR